MTRLAVPIMLAELGWIAMGLVDTIVVGRVGPEGLAAVSLGTIIFYGFAAPAGGVVLGLDTLVSQAHGAGDREDGRHSLVQGMWIAAMLIPIVMGAVWGVDLLFPMFGIAPDVVRATRPYLHALIWSTPPLMVFFAARRYLQAVHRVRPVMWTLVTANLLNLAGNWALVFGHLGARAMGVVGSGWSTCIARTFMAAALMIVICRRDPEIWATAWRADFRRIRELLRLGLPAAGQMALEIGVFALVTILIGRLNAMSLAANQIAVITVSTTYMLPLGVSSAAAVRVGNRLGAGDARGAAHSGWIAVGMGAAVMSVAAAALLIVPQWIARLFTPNAGAIAAGATLLRIAAFFELFDGLQVVVTGALRGTGDTRTPLLCHFGGYWLIGLPLGAALCFGRGLGAAGLWAGLSAGLIVIGMVLVAWWRRAARRLAMVN